MKYLLFNAVVLASLGYLFAADGRLELPFQTVGSEAGAPGMTAELPVPTPTTEALAPEKQVVEEQVAEEPIGTSDPAPASVPASVPAPSHDLSASQDPVAAAAPPMFAGPSPTSVDDPVFTAPPEIETVAEVEALPETVVSPQSLAPAAPPVPDGAPVQIAEGQSLMTTQERTRELDRLIENMELFYIERLAR